jgi:hypothetical protein
MIEVRHLVGWWRSPETRDRDGHRDTTTYVSWLFVGGIEVRHSLSGGAGWRTRDR